MSKKNAIINISAESNLPSDLFTNSLGSNYGLDGYPDLEYGVGVLEGVLNPEYMPAPALPTGLQSHSGEELDLTAFLKEGSNISDLSWLDPSQLQDPERLPETPKSIPELEDAWSHRGKGTQYFALDLEEARYREKASSEEDQPGKVTSKHIAAVTTHAMRRSAQGQNIDTIVKEALESMGEGMGQVAPFLKLVREEHGLVGNVYLRASAYPGWGTGKWAKQVKRYASRAMFLLVSEKDLKGADWIKNGRCIYTSKLAVTEIPWAEAYAHYAPRLLSAGYKVASGDHREALKAAFLSQPVKKGPDSENRPVHVDPSQRISLQEAKKAFAEYVPPKRVVYDPNPAIQAKILKDAKAKITLMAKHNLIPLEEAQSILATEAPPRDMLRAASLVANRVKVGSYQGSADSLEGLRALKALASGRANVEALEAQARVAQLDPEGDRQRAIVAKARNKVQAWVTKGLIPVHVGTTLLKAKAHPQDLLRAAASIAAKVKKGTYQGDDTGLEGLRALRAASQARELQATKEAIATVAKLDPEGDRQRALVAKAHAQIRSMVARGILPEQTCKEIIASEANPKDKVRTAATLSFRMQKGEYQGDPNTFDTQRLLTQARLERKASEVIASDMALQDHYNKKLAQYQNYDALKCEREVNRWIATGMVSKERVASFQETDYRKLAHLLMPEVAGIKVVSGEHLGTVIQYPQAKDVSSKQIMQEIKASLISKEAVQSYLDKEAEKRKQASTREARDQRTLASLVQKVKAEIDRGVRGAMLRNIIARTIPKDIAPQALKLLAPILTRTGALEEAPVEKRLYNQPQFSRAATGVKGNTVLAGQVLKAALWLRRTMSEGFAGEDLSSLIEQRFSEGLRTASADAITNIRATHEGASGFLYVDAEAYATPEGVKGCEQGALKHRSNGIPAVLEMSRCGSCVNAQTLPDGTRKCSLYNKELASLGEGEDLDVMKYQNIQRANMSDAEATASLFAPSYDPTEFGLKNANLENLELEFPDIKTLSKITFGDWDLS